ncbi:MAG TPA: response regulator transcription factor, partial [Thermomicrobiales bacterium]|nr:response regulator transcription factor [Thermomicrobiales bacterium]
GIILKTEPLDRVVAIIRAVANGGSAQPPAELIDLLRLANQARDQHDEAKRALQRLTPREVEILRALATGLMDKEIAHALQISTNTVAAHIVHILRKLQVQSRLQAVLLGVKYGLVTL